MKINPIKLPHLDPLIVNYRNHQEALMEFFDYSPFHDFQKRISDLKARDFNREALTGVLTDLNKDWDAPASSLANIERLKSDESVVVIGGQQAGLLSGPLYTVNKIISVIQLAAAQEKELGVPVIPVFWIAGEDHDYDEINHIYLLEALEMRRYRTGHQVSGKEAISEIDLDATKTQEWLDQVFSQLAETDYTKDLHETVQTCLKQSKTYVDFFARFIFALFNEQGLVLIDSGDQRVREIEADYFVKMIEKQPAIAQAVHQAYQHMSQAGYSIMLDVERTDTHLFYLKDHERILLERNEHGAWVGKQQEVCFTTEEMVTIAKTTPHLLSNNVVTRPLMQEFLFPTLAFVGGNGEISYWSILKNAFHEMGLHMPPVVPRLSFTYVSEQVSKQLHHYDVRPAHVLSGSLTERRNNWLASKQHPPLDLMIEQLKETITQAHLPLRQVAASMRADLGDVAKTNLLHLHKEVDFLEKTLKRALEEKYAKGLADFDLMEASLYPLGGLQERVWNPLAFLNNYGLDFFTSFTKDRLSIEQAHYFIYL